MAALTAGAQLPEVSPVARAVTARTAGLQVGGVVAYLGGRVLGQYDPFGGAGRRRAAAAGGAQRARRAAGARRAAAPTSGCGCACTRPPTGCSSPRCRGCAPTSPTRSPGSCPSRRTTAAPSWSGCPRWCASLRESGGDSLAIVELLQGPEQRAVLDRLLALTTLLEGHADHVMDAVGPDVVPDGRHHPRPVHRAPPRRRPRSTACCARCSGWRPRCASTPWVPRSPGTWCSPPVWTGFNRVWESPETLPTRAELADPGRWLPRVHGL